MKKIILLACLIFSITAGAQEFPKPSLLAKTYQMVGVTEVEIEYSSPGVKGRTIFGDVVPFQKVWRTGANMATVISFSDPIQIGEEKIPAGEYAVFSTPTSGSIQFYLNSDTEQGGTSSYDPALNVAVFSVGFEKTKETVERLTFTFENTTNEGSDLRMSWGNRTCVIPLKVNTQEIALLNYKEKLTEYNDAEFNLYTQAASYFLEIGYTKDAVEVGELSVNMRKKFWNTHALALAYQAAGEKDKAVAMAKVSLDLSVKAEYPAYIKKNNELLAELGK